jgi:outer membrane protein OmpA-like peptidoglycan-associated protein
MRFQRSCVLLSLLAACLAATGCGGARIDLAPLTAEVAALQDEAADLAADSLSLGYLEASRTLSLSASAFEAENKSDRALVNLESARAAAITSVTAAVTARRETQAAECRQAQAESRRDWEDALHQLEQTEKISGREARGITRATTDRVPSLYVPEMPPSPRDAVDVERLQSLAREWRELAVRLQVPSADLESAWTAALAGTAAPKAEPWAVEGRQRRAAWAVTELAWRVRSEMALRACARATQSASEYRGYRDHILWAMVDLERGMKETARRKLEEELNRMEMRQNDLFNSLKQFEGKFASIRREARGTILSLSDILFDFDQATLRREAEINLAKVAVILGQYGEMEIRIEGHTDNIGSAEYNQGLSERRAEAVYTFLSENGVDSARMTTMGFGMTQPVASNADEAGRQKNRRVDLVIRELADD